jgi:ABC-type dipeptide/oligopeptide/nickel transport system ATPase component
MESPEATGEPTPPSHLQSRDNLTLEMLGEKWRRLNVKNEHWMLCIVGEEGSGKSYTAVKIGELVDPNFSAANVFFHPADVLERLRDGRYQEGDVWVLDEAGVGLGSRTWHDDGQVMLNQALQLIRSHNIGLIFTLPALDDLDLQAKRRLQNAYEIKSKKEGEFVKGRWYRAQVDRMGFSNRSGVWWEGPHIRGSKLRTVSFTLPSEELVEEYEARKQKFQEQFYDDTIAELRGEENEETDDRSVEEIVEMIEKEEHGVAPYLSWHGAHQNAYINKDELRATFDLSHSDAQRLKAKLQQSKDVDPQAAWEAKHAN